jgi:hypothetical protein
MHAPSDWDNAHVHLYYTKTLQIYTYVVVAGHEGWVSDLTTAIACRKRSGSVVPGGAGQRRQGQYEYVRSGSFSRTFVRVHVHQLLPCAAARS